MSSLRPSRLRTPADASLDDAEALSPPILSKSPRNPFPGGGIWRQKSHAAGGAKAAAAARAPTNDAAEGRDAGAESGQCLSPRHISSRNLADGANLDDHPFDEAARGGRLRPTSLPSAVRSGLKLGNEIKSTDEATFEEEEDEEKDDNSEAGTRDDSDVVMEREESLTVNVDTYLDEVKAPKEGEIAETPSKKKKNSSKKRGRKNKKSNGKKKGANSTEIAFAAGVAHSGLTAANLASLDEESEAPSDEEVDDAYFSLSNSLSGFSSVTGASDLNAADTTAPKQGTSTSADAKAALRLSLWRDRDTVILSQTSPTKSRAATAATAAADVIVTTSQKRAGGAGGPETVRPSPRAQGELLLPSLRSGVASSVHDESAVDQASGTVSSIMARGTATPRGRKSSSSTYAFETIANAASSDGSGVKKEVSFTQVRDAMRRFLSTPPKAGQEGPANAAAAAAATTTNKPRPSELPAAFWSKCAVLAAVAVMATAKSATNRVQIAQAAAETVLSKCPKGEDADPTDEDWRVVAAEGLEDLAAEVSSAIIAVGSQGGNTTASTAAAASAAAVVLLNQKEALQIPTTDAPTEQKVSSAPPSPDPLDDTATTTAEVETAKEEPKDASDEAPKKIAKEDMIESWRKEDDDDDTEDAKDDRGADSEGVATTEDTSTPAATEKALEKTRSVESELLSVGEAPAPSLDAKDVAIEDDNDSAPAAAAAVAAIKSENEVEAENEADKPKENEPDEQQKHASPAPEGWLNIDRELPQSIESPAEEKTLGSKIALTVSAASVAAASVAASAAASAAATTVEACCSPTQATSAKEALVEIEAPAETKDGNFEVANAAATYAKVEVAPKDETLGSKIALGTATASAAGALTATACLSPTDAALSMETKTAEIESKSMPTLAVDEVAKDERAGTDEKTETTQADLIKEECIPSVAAEVLSAIEESVNAEPKEVETSTKRVVEIEASAHEEVTATTGPSSAANKADAKADASQAVAKNPVEEEKPADEDGKKEKLFIGRLSGKIVRKVKRSEKNEMAMMKSKNTQLLEDLENKQKERNAKLDKLRDFEVYLASAAVVNSKEDGLNEDATCAKSDFLDLKGASPKSAGDETEVSLKEDVAVEETNIAEPAATPEPVSADAAEAVIISSEAERETEVSLSSSNTAAQQNTTTDKTPMESENSADVEVETTTTEDLTSTLKSNDAEDEKPVGAVSAARTLKMLASLQENTVEESTVAEITVCDTLEEAPSTDVGCHVNFCDTVKDGLVAFSAEGLLDGLVDTVATCTGNPKRKNSSEKEAKVSKEVAEEPAKEPTEDESKEVDGHPGYEEQAVPTSMPEPVDEVAPPAATSVATVGSAVEEKQAEIIESSGESTSTQEEEKENYPAESVEVVDEAPQLPEATNAVIQVNAAEPTPPKKSKKGKAKFSSVKKMFKKKKCTKSEF